MVVGFPFSLAMRLLFHCCRVAPVARIAGLVLVAACATPVLAQSPPSIAKQFNPSSIQLLSVSSLNFTITNPNPSTTLFGVAFADTLPVGLTVADSIFTVCGGTFTTSFNFRTIQLSGATIAANSTCQFSVVVTGAASGQYTNVTGNVSSTNGGTGNNATANLTVFTLSIARSHDFNFDGRSDILWRDSSGNIAVWLMNGTTIQSSVGLGNVGTSFKIAETGDFNADGHSDIAWQDSAGNVAIWLMNGTTIVSAVGLGNVGTTWKIQGTNAD